ncbi:hypothetical protein D3C71_2191440 [compost metagenome]
MVSKRSIAASKLISDSPAQPAEMISLSIRVLLHGPYMAVQTAVGKTDLNQISRLYLMN